MIYHRIILGFSLLLLTCQLSAQSKANLEQERQRIQDEIEKASQFLEKTDQRISSNLKNYNLLESKITNRKALIGNIEEEITNADNLIGRLGVEIDSLNKIHQKLNLAYQDILRKNYVNKMSRNDLLNFFSAKSFMEAYKKWIYSNQYKNFLKTRKLELQINQAALDSAYNHQKAEQIQRQQLLDTRQGETQKLDKELRSKDLLIAKLEKEQASVKIELLAKQKKQKELKKAIERIILAEMEKQRLRASTNEEAVLLSGDFKEHKGELPNPVPRSVIVGRYGKQPHPSNPSLQIENNGIDIQSSAGSQVRAIFQGVVVGNTFIPGVGNMLILRHGEYYSVYSKLTQVLVNQGDQVNMNQQIGTIDDILHFEIWQGKEKQDPSFWLKKY